MEQFFNRGICKALESNAIEQLERKLEKSESIQCKITPTSQSHINIELYMMTHDGHKHRLFGKGDMKISNLTCKPFSENEWTLISEYGFHQRMELYFYAIPPTGEIDYEILIDSLDKGAPFPKKNAFGRSTVAMMLRHLLRAADNYPSSNALQAISQLADHLKIQL